MMECSSPGPARVYMCGKDDFNILTRDVTEDSVNPLPIPVNFSFVDILCKTTIELIVYRKSHESCTWYAKGFGIGCTTEQCTSAPDFSYPEVELFSSDLQITRIAETPAGVIGLSDITNIFYHSLLTFDTESDQFQLSLQEIAVKQVRRVDEASDQNEEYTSKFTHLASEDTVVYAVDETSSIYNVLKNELVWKLSSGKITKLVSGFSHSLVLTDTGAVYGWGNGSRGQLGQEVIILSCPSPQRIEFFDDLPCIVRDIAAGGWHTLALTCDGDVYAWGWNESNQLGLPSELVPSVQGTPYPVDLGSSSNPIVAISAGSRHSVVQMKDGSVYAWGFNKFGQLGVGDTINRQLPVKLELSNLNMKQEGTPCNIICGRWNTFIAY